MRRKFLLSIMVLGAVILTGSLVARAQQDPYEPAATTSTASGQTDSAAEPTSTAQQPSTDTQATDQSAQHNDADAQMPKTASPLPLIALVGILSIGASLSLRSMSRLANDEADASDR